jgi:ribosome maturation factor RimP
VLKVGFAAHLFFDHMPTQDHLYDDIEGRLAASLPDVELLACEPIGADRLRVVIDHPDGVSLGLCERVTHELSDLLTDYGLEVASPGPERPLTKPEHFRRYIGRPARVRTREPRKGRKSFTGELVGASEEEVALAAETGVVAIPYAEIARSNLLKGEG